jgi:hypothetical protein
MLKQSKSQKIDSRVAINIPLSALKGDFDRKRKSGLLRKSESLGSGQLTRLQSNTKASSGNKENLSLNYEQGGQPKPEKPQIISQSAAPEPTPSSFVDFKDSNALKKDLFCRCKQSKCTQGYCVCLMAGRECNENCGCTNCENNESNPKREEMLLAFQ